MPESLLHTRKTEVWLNGSWVLIHMEQMRKGDIFRMWNPDGKPVADEKGNRYFICFGPAEVKCDPFNQPLPTEDSSLI